jgi:hypothetical protein
MLNQHTEKDNLSPKFTKDNLLPYESPQPPFKRGSEQLNELVLRQKLIKINFISSASPCSNGLKHS